MPYEVSTPVFEGPFDLLLQLINREQVDLWEVSILDIVDGFVAALDEVSARLDLDVATEFLLIAALLLDIKARRLLPEPEGVELDLELGAWEERDLLLARLFECKTFKDAAAALQQMADTAELSYPRVAGLEERFTALAPDLLAGVTAPGLRDAFARARAREAPARVDLGHVAASGLSVRQAMNDLTRELRLLGSVTFRRLTSHAGNRPEVIVRFLAVLELYKEGSVSVDQPSTFGELTVTWAEETASLAGGRIQEYSGSWPN